MHGLVGLTLLFPLQLVKVPLLSRRLELLLQLKSFPSDFDDFLPVSLFCHRNYHVSCAAPAGVRLCRWYASGGSGHVRTYALSSLSRICGWPASRVRN